MKSSNRYLRAQSDALFVSIMNTPTLRTKSPNYQTLPRSSEAQITGIATCLCLIHTFPRPQKLQKPTFHPATCLKPLLDLQHLCINQVTLCTQLLPLSRTIFVEIVRSNQCKLQIKSQCLLQRDVLSTSSLSMTSRTTCSSLPVP